MISLTCTNCQAELTMDDAFAGGVCRCQYCGTIQTVPTKSAGATASKALYQKAAAASDSSAGGLADLDLGSSGSGLSSGGFANAPSQPAQVPRSDPPSVQPAQPQAKRGSPWLAIAIIAGILVLGTVAAGVFFLTRGNSAQTEASAGPTFGGVSLNGNSISYLLDNSSSNDTVFDPLKAACYKSLQTLGPDRRFQVMLWENSNNTVVYPIDGLHNAMPTEIAACKRALADTIATGNSRLAGPLKAAVAQKPSAIVIATGKWDLSRDDLSALSSASESGIRLYTFGLGAAPEQGALKLAASATGGQYKHLTASDLKQAGD
jgi:hypothetical protein